MGPAPGCSGDRARAMTVVGTARWAVSRRPGVERGGAGQRLQPQLGCIGFFLVLSNIEDPFVLLEGTLLKSKLLTRFFSDIAAQFSRLLS